jgi:adenosylcobinamide amidohydrolase
MHWETLAVHPEFQLRRRGRLVVAEFCEPHRVLSTSARNGGQRDDLQFLINHQSCEGAGHEERHAEIMAAGEEGYHDLVCAEAGVPPGRAATMGTAASMHYVAVATEADADAAVTAVVTGGVTTNATCAGDPARWRETGGGVERTPSAAGTINIMLLVSVPLTANALARAVVTMTEGKSAALQRLVIPSRQSADLATGTGTDQYCVAAPLRPAGERTSTSPHVKLGELIGRAARSATLEALRWQNGLEPSYTRGVFHALGRYGVTEPALFADLDALLDERNLALLRKNSMAALFDPLAGAAAYALAAVCDRVRHGALPGLVQREAAVQQAALLAANIAAQPQRWPEFRARLHDSGATDARSLAVAAIALGWAERWRPA